MITISDELSVQSVKQSGQVQWRILTIWQLILRKGEGGKEKRSGKGMTAELCNSRNRMNQSCGRGEPLSFPTRESRGFLVGSGLSTSCSPPPTASWLWRPWLWGLITGSAPPGNCPGAGRFRSRSRCTWLDDPDPDATTATEEDEAPPELPLPPS